MTERHPPVRDPHLHTVAAWHPVEATPAEEGGLIDCASAAAIENPGSTGPRGLEGD